MENGRISVKRARGSFLLFGLGWSQLYWEDAAARESELLADGDYFEAYRCPSCEAVLTDPQRTRETKPKPYVPENLF